MINASNEGKCVEFWRKATQPWLTLTFKLPQLLTQFKTNP